MKNEFVYKNMENNQAAKQFKNSEKKQKFARQRMLRQIAKTAATLVAAGGSFGGLIWYLTSFPAIPEQEILSKNGLHWHSEVSIIKNGERQEIPANVGIGVTHQPLHTHDESGIIHLEFQGVVRRENTKLGNFLKTWDKDISAFGALVSMTVNGESNNELGDYQMKDGDKIELIYD